MQFYPDEEENPEYWWDVELDDVRHEVYSIEKDEDDPYNQYREWEGKISRENKVASFRFVHHYMHVKLMVTRNWKETFQKDLSQ